MSVRKNILLALIALAFQGCMDRTITDYENCVSPGLTVEFTDKKYISVINDSEGKNKYSSMNFPSGEYYLCIEEEEACDDFSGYYYTGWSMEPLRSKTIQLTGKYKVNTPRAFKSAFAPETKALQVLVEGKKAWIALYDIRDVSDFKESSHKNIQEINKNRKLTTDWNDWMTTFECPSPKAKKVNSTTFWFY